MTMSRSLLIGLIVSAALNVFLVGGVVGVLWVRQAPPTPAVATPTLPRAGPVTDEVPPPGPSAPPFRRPQSTAVAGEGLADGLAQVYAPRQRLAQAGAKMN